MAAERIANRQMLFMLFMIRTTVVIATLPVVTTGEAAQDAWAAALIALMATLAIVLAIGGLGARFPSMTVVEYSRRLLGKFVGGMISLGFLWLFLHIAATDTRIYAELIVGGFLTQTPLLFVVGTMVLPSALAVYLGIEVIGRVADTLVVFFSLFVMTTILAAFGAFDPKNLEPVLARGIGPVLSGALTPIAIGAQFLSLAMLVPALTMPKKATTSGLLAAALSGLVLVASGAVVVGVLGPDLAVNSVFPTFEVARSTMLTRFLERLEAPSIVAWGFGLFVDVSAFLYCGALGLSQLLGLEDYRALVGPMAVIWVILATHGYEDMFEVLRLFEPNVIFPYIAAVVFIPYALLWATYGVRALLGKLPGQEGGAQDGRRG